MNRKLFATGALAAAFVLGSQFGSVRIAFASAAPTIIYQVVPVRGSNPQDVSVALNQAGQTGWKLVTIINGSDNYRLMVFTK